MQRILELAGQLVALQAELDQELEKRRRKWGWDVHKRLVTFENGVTAEHERLKIGVSRFLAESRWPTILSAPLVYSLIIPFVLLDLWVSAYQAGCFRIYRIPRVRRSEYIALDRSKLRYLNWIEALNCEFCSYCNGVIAYAREIASRTEQYWCPIKHALRIPSPHDRYWQFAEYGDAEGYRARLNEFREALQAKEEGNQPQGAIQPE
ncbi:hypothetical protein G7076_04825 [Sphingomonas sp. HDW15A]|uniref:hypothetical protein n=1 Tax=Sphingomonas sp. HDW15A TaxID=2714942 RepID=UPI00140C1723|nr:hypothetical protein [Sphingomonas sp. HDW15A]QIK95880.1 hypothetical protein G7076_04825 [Sphingomonas sp. HDW15A]